jgi:hypothetical protein
MSDAAICMFQDVRTKLFWIFDLPAQAGFGLKRRAGKEGS